MRHILLAFGLFVVITVVAPPVFIPVLHTMGYRHIDPRMTVVYDFVFTHPWGAAGITALFFGAFLLAYRQGLLLWGRLVSAIGPKSGLEPEQHGFPWRSSDMVKEIADARALPGMLFVGLSPVRRSVLPGWTWKRVYLDDKQRTSHRHVLGRTGSGKTTSVLWPQVLQDALAGKGVVVIDAKGSDENIRAMKFIAAVANRQQDLRVFSLPAWDEPELFTHNYNLVWVKPRTKTSRGGNPTAVAERVFSVLPMGEDPFYKTQGLTAFTSLVRLLHGMVDRDGNGLPFNLEDIAVCLQGAGCLADKTSPYARAFRHCLDTSLDRRAAEELRGQLATLGDAANAVLSGLAGALRRFQSDTVNAYAPDFNFEEVLERNLLVYVQLPTNLYKLQAPALGKAMLMDLQQAASMRQVFRRERNQRHFSVVVDEFASFADKSIIDSLNKLRDANIQFTLAHQSLADLESVGKDFAQAVWDNTLTKDVLAQDNPELCERIAKSLGTKQQTERTVRVAAAPLFTEGLTGDASARRVEAYRLHPNAIKQLPACGQGWLLGAAHIEKGGLFGGTRLTTGPTPICYPPPEKGLLEGADFPLPRNDQAKAPGLNLYKEFIEGAAMRNSVSAAPAAAPGQIATSTPSRTTTKPPTPDVAPMRSATTAPKSPQPAQPPRTAQARRPEVRSRRQVEFHEDDGPDTATGTHRPLRDSSDPPSC